MRQDVKDKETITVKELKKQADEVSCPVQRSLFYVDEFLKGPMCGQCFPCAFGSYEAKVSLESIVEGMGSEKDITSIKRIADNILAGALCKKGRQAADYILECVDSDHFGAHIKGRCPDKLCKAFIEYRIIPDKCTMCGLCKDVCENNAILGINRKNQYDTGYLPFEIRQKRCKRSGACKDICPTGAIVVIGLPAGKPTGISPQIHTRRY